MMLVELGEHCVVLEVGRQRSGRAHNLKAQIDVVAEVTGVAEEVTRRDCRAIGGGDGWKQRMTVGEVYPGVADLREGRRAFGAYGGGTQPVGDEQDDVLL